MASRCRCRSDSCSRLEGDRSSVSPLFLKQGQAAARDESVPRSQRDLRGSKGAPACVLFALVRARVFAAIQPELQPVKRRLLNSEDLLRVLRSVSRMLVSHRHHIHLRRLVEISQATINFPAGDDLSDAGRLTDHQERRLNMLRAKTRRVGDPLLDARAERGSAVQVDIQLTPIAKR